MGDKTGIEWTDATWNPIRGCSKVSEGCRNCYAATVAARFSGPGMAYEGLAKRDGLGKGQWTGEVRVIEEHLLDPLRWRNPRRVFVNSMSDLFHEDLPDYQIADIYGVMAAAWVQGKGHTFQVLTKRPARAARLLNDERFQTAVQAQATYYTDPKRLPDLVDVPWPLPNVWLGASVEDQDTAYDRVPSLVDAPAVVRFLSLEPLLGPIQFRGIPAAAMLDWIIIGGESGQGARPMDLAWVRGLLGWAHAAGVAPFVKQLGSVWADANGGPSKGGDPASWPADLRLREMPT